MWAAPGAAGARPVPGDAELQCSFPQSEQSPGHARRFVAASLRSWGLEPLVDDAMLVVTELATNAVVHAASSFTVALARRDGAMRISVGDGAAALPHARARNDALEGGRGLEMVSGVAARWGCARRGAGKLVWAELDAR